MVLFIDNLIFINAISNRPYEFFFVIECHFYNVVHAEMLQERLAYFPQCFFGLILIHHMTQ
jgi:hypothetical protein